MVTIACRCVNHSWPMHRYLVHQLIINSADRCVLINNHPELITPGEFVYLDIQSDKDKLTELMTLCILAESRIPTCLSVISYISQHKLPLTLSTIKEITYNVEKEI